MTVSNELDEQYVLEAQDPNEPVWATDATIADMKSVDDPNDEYTSKGDGSAVPVVRTSSGKLDFMKGVEEVVESFLENDNPIPLPKNKLESIRTRELGSDKWRPSVRVVGSSPAAIVTQSSKRRRVVLVNHGPNTAYLLPQAGGTSGQGARLLPVTVELYPERVLYTRDDVWAVCASSESATVEVIEEFDMDS